VASRFADVSENVGFVLKIETVRLSEKSACRPNTTKFHGTRTEIRWYNVTVVCRKLKENTRCEKNLNKPVRWSKGSI
jgi:hypothetical protein